MKLVKKGQSGQAIIMALILLALGSLVITPLLMQGITNLKYHDTIQLETLLAYSADSGVEYALYEVYNNPEEYQSAPLHYTDVINNITVNVTAEYVPSMAAYKITSTATGANDKSTTIVTYVVIEIGLFGNAFACDGDLTIKNCDWVSDEPGECDVYASGNVLLKNSTVDGDVTAGGWIELQNSSCLEQYPYSEILDFPAIDAQTHKEAAKEGGTYTGTYTSGGPLGPLYIDGDLTITGTDVILEGTVYVTGDVDITNANISGSGDIVAEGNISMNNYTFKVDDPVILPLLMTCGIDKVIDCTNDGGDSDNLNTQAVLYAPDGVIDLDNVFILGSAAANQILVTNAYFNYPAGLKGRPDLPGAGLATITYGYE